MNRKQQNSRQLNTSKNKVGNSKNDENTKQANSKTDKIVKLAITGQ